MRVTIRFKNGTEEYVEHFNELLFIPQVGDDVHCNEDKGTAYNVVYRTIYTDPINHITIHAQNIPLLEKLKMWPYMAARYTEL